MEIKCVFCAAETKLLNTLDKYFKVLNDFFTFVLNYTLLSKKFYSTPTAESRTELNLEYNSHHYNLFFL